MGLGVTGPGAKDDIVGDVLNVVRLARVTLGRIETLRPFWRDEEDPFVTIADKIVVESALLALLAARIGPDGSRLDDELTGVAAGVREHIYTSRNVGLLMRFPHTAVSLGIAHAALLAFGTADPDVDWILRSVLADGQTEAYERLPYRAMELAWLKAELGEPSRELSVLFAASSASAAGNPLHMTLNEVYALTHAVMYATDFGAAPWPWEEERDAVRTAIDAHLRWHLHTGNLDLIGELVLSELLLDGTSAAGREGWARLRAAWSQLGFIPGPAFVVAEHAELTGIAAAAYSVRHIYHSTYVWGILCATAAGRTRPMAGGAEHDPVVHDRATRQAVARECCDAAARAEAFAGRAAPVMAAWTTPDEAPYDSIQCDGALIDAVRRYDLPAVQELLGRAVAARRPVTRTMLDVVRFLCRQQLSEGAIGVSLLAAENRGRPDAAEITATFAVLLRDVAGVLDAEPAAHT
jgi:hypothetical protein